jgi:uncharacterized protein YdaU (DUF1376 family)
MTNKTKGNDPAFLFYVNDFDTGTKFFTDEQLGKFLRLLIAQFQHGPLSEKQVLFICRELDQDILKKFQRDEEGNYFNARLKDEIEKRKKFSESRSNNRKGKNNEQVKNISNSYDDTLVQHMENENEDEDVIEDLNKNTIDIYPFSESFLKNWNEWKSYRKAQHRFKYKSLTSEQNMFNLLVKKASNRESVAIEILNYTMAHGWKLFVLPKNYKNEPTDRDADRIDYWNNLVENFGTEEEKKTRRIERP